MYTNNAYLNNSTLDIKDKSKPLIVTSCGTYHLYTRPKLPTWRPRGRLDFQLLYIASGKAHFHFDGKEQIVTAGHMVLYRPKEPQKYEYYGEDQTEVYWVHFTGGNVTNLLRSYGLTDDKKVFYCGSGMEYQTIFRSMINELQMCKENYPEMLEMYLKQIFIMLQRFFQTSAKVSNTQAAEEIDKATLYFNEHYSEDIYVDEYAKEHNISISWFIRNFKHYTGVTPMQYILNKRIYNAEALLQNPQYNITEIANIVGYDNPLYFSRIFKKAKGLSPSEYRKNINL
ncbi:MAG: helix-turn-helix transcriptional regulator [Lachnospiraceae bacterium]|nr:helix-turn-helix transcriptional regulator [Lachnospiraceae bacterium]MBQ8847245.1 helix-turn-helix transcriptional regulator [Lachnospiraceae bacterium]